METQPDRISLKPVALGCGMLLLAHLAVDGLLTGPQATLPSGILLLLENLAAAVACVWRARRCRGPGNLLWSLAAAAETIHLGSGIETGLEMVFFHLPHNATSPSDFLIFLWGVPLLLALGGATESRPLRVFYWLDGTQITLVMTVLFLVVFGALPLRQFSGSPLSGIGAVWAYAIENAVIAMVALLRLQSRAPVREQRAFFTSITIVMTLYAVLGPVYNFSNVHAAQPSIRLQWVLAFHQLALVLLAVRPATWPSTPGRSPRYRTLALALDNGSPIVYPTFVVVGAVIVLPRYLHLGLAILIISLLCYGTRSTILQVQLQKAQWSMADAQRRLEHLTLTDPLTGIANRRAFDARLSEAWQQWETSGRPFCVYAIDVDHFKILNDTLGHAEGDRSLCAIAEALPGVLPDASDLLARVGGEEFAAILSCESPAEAISIAEEMLAAVRALRLPNRTPPGNTVSISVGVAMSSHALAKEDMMQRADEALYAAKRAGRNRAAFASSEQG